MNLKDIAVELAALTVIKDAVKEATDELRNLGINYDIDTGVEVSYLFGSGILNSQGIRIDCGCHKIECSGTEITVSSCGLGPFMDSSGQFDGSPDKLDYKLHFVNNDECIIQSIYANGMIPSFLEIIN